MKRSALRVGFLLLFLAPTGNSTGQARQLTFQDRVRAQEAIERVYYSHQIGATRPFEEAVPQIVLEEKVRTYLKQSLALEEFWSTSVTSEALEQELERIARNTRLPDRLVGMYGALSNDPVLVQETLVRQALVDRLSRSFQSSDPSIQHEPLQEVEDLRSALLTGTLDFWEDDLRRTVTLIREAKGPGTPRLTAASGFLPLESETGQVLMLPPEEYTRLRRSAPVPVGEIGPVSEEQDSYTIKVLLAEGARSAKIATYSVPKVDWDSWWSSVSPSLDEGQVGTVALASTSLPEPRQGPSASLSQDPGTSSSSCGPDDVWDNGSLDDQPEGRAFPSVVWTGTEMIVWGGSVVITYNNGARYNPLTDSWATVSMVGAPGPRALHTVVWTGSEMIVWGGNPGSGFLNTGGRYDPVQDVWRPMSQTNAPMARYEHTAVWVGGVMVVWGGRGGGVGSGFQLASGGRYDPVTDSWTPTSMSGAPSARSGQAAVAASGLMLIWGGGLDNGIYFRNGARYDPALDVWSPMAAFDAPPAPWVPVVSTGTEMIVWGGFFDGPPYTAGGGRYNPITNTWSPISSQGAPLRRYYHTAVWSGSEMIVWGGQSGSGTYFSGGRYNPATDTWRTTTGLFAPSARSGHVAVWTGSLMLVWGSDTWLTSGGRYDPVKDAWTRISGPQGPSATSGNTAVWTGNQMIVWGGASTVSSGARYNPLLDTWPFMAKPNSTVQHVLHTAVWTGNVMILWGGREGHESAPFTNKGDAYDPISNKWRGISNTGAPLGRTHHSAIWTGTRMVVWGGYNADVNPPLLNSGGRYDPVTDTWSPTSTLNAPSPRDKSSAIWTGSRMVVWGGETSTDGQMSNSGSLYDPATDSWSPMSTTSAPFDRSFHTAVWSGREMIVWGGYTVPTSPTGGRYDPSTNSWRPTSTVGAPEGRTGHTAIWTGQQMIVWGGLWSSGGDSRILNSGGRYDPVSDLWRTTSLVNVPEEREQHSAIWTGDQMIIWGGYHSSGGRYRVDLSTDSDHDLFGVCSGDCDDSARTVYAGAPQLCDGLNNNCSDPAWPAVASDEADDDGDGFRVCANDCDDASPTVYSGAPQICGDGLNNDCSHPNWPTLSGTNEVDNDGDGFTGCANDCDDTRPAVYPGAEQRCDGLNDDCDDPAWPAIAPAEYDSDRDGFLVCQGDCNDGNPLVNPGVTEICNGIDENCDGQVDEDQNGQDTDADGVRNRCDNCPLTSNPGQEDRVHPNSMGDACDDPDVDGVTDEMDNCVDTANSGQVDADEDGPGDACDICPAIYNPGQEEVVACMEVGVATGRCIPTQISLVSTEPPPATGKITVSAYRLLTPTSITFEVKVSSCYHVDQMEFFLNGGSLGTFHDGFQNCACASPIQSMTVSDAALLASLWNPSGNNVLRFTKEGDYDLGSFLAQVRARIVTPEGERTECLLAPAGNDCELTNECYRGSDDAIDYSTTLTEPILVDEGRITVDFTDGRLPEAIDISSLPAAKIRLCAQTKEPGTLYGANGYDALFRVDPAQGTTSAVGPLTFNPEEIEYDDLGNRAFAMGTYSFLREFDIRDGKPIGPEIDTEYHHFTALEFIEDRLYGTAAGASGLQSDLRLLAPSTGHSKKIGPTGRGKITGLAYDENSGVMYAVELGSTARNLLTINLTTGAATIVGPLGVTVDGLEFGADGLLYGGADFYNWGKVYRINKVTGAATPVPLSGFPLVTSLTLAAPIHRDCVELVKETQGTLAINRPCNAPPTAAAGADLSAECSSPVGAGVTLDGSASSDVDSPPGTNGDIVQFEWFEDFGSPSQALLGAGETLNVTLPLGAHPVTLRVTDAAGESSLDGALVSVVDTIAPALAVAPSPATLWPPNHRMVPVQMAAAAQDLCDASPSVALVSVVSSEPDDAPGSGDGSTVNDIQDAAFGSPELGVTLRAERDATGRGRIYTVSYSAADASGNSVALSSLVSVPHDQNGVTEPVDISLRETTGGTVVEWTDVPGALFYNVIKGDIGQLREMSNSIDLGQVQCIEAGSTDASTSGRGDTSMPAAGRAYFYLVEHNDGWASSYGSESLQKPRVPTGGACSGP